MVGVPLKAQRGARVEIRLPGEDEYSPLKKRRTVVEPGTAVKVSKGAAEVVGPEGAGVVLQDGSSGVVLGSTWITLRALISESAGQSKSPS